MIFMINFRNTPPERTHLGNLAKRAIRKGLTVTGFDRRNWLRIRQIEAFTAFLQIDGRDDRPVLEVSPGWNKQWEKLCSDYHSVAFPEFDICKNRTQETFHTVIADQVLEHVRSPAAAAQNIHTMVAPGGWAMVATPFLFRVHARPYDYTRWTPSGLKQLMVDGGFDEADVSASGWGNKACAKAHVGGPVRSYGYWRDLSNDEEYPLMVWAFARKRDA
jgi:SAM-dependent methyltransferase